MKYLILDKLKSSPGKYISGEALSEQLGVSRTAVWKSIRGLRAEGYEIDACSKKGYSLSVCKDILNAFEITNNLTTKVLGRSIQYFDEIDSTNTYAKKIASEGCSDGTVVVAGMQHSGRGRLGREWESAPDKGIWMSVVLRPLLPPEDVQILTLAASVAVVNALKNCTGIQTGIKWPNDIVIDGKKVCGILTEISCELDRVNYIVVGIGVNVNHEEEDFPRALCNRAVSLRLCSELNQLTDSASFCQGLYKRSDIIKSILTELESVYSIINRGCSTDIIDLWKKYSVTLGREIKATIKGNEYIGTAEDITSDGRLVLKCSDGASMEILSGDVMVRGILGYV